MWRYYKANQVTYYANPFHFEVSQSNVEYVQLLIDCGIDVQNSMHYACVLGSPKIVELLVRHSLTSVATSKANNLWTIFHMAVINEDPGVLELILDLFRYEDDVYNDD